MADQEDMQSGAPPGPPAAPGPASDRPRPDRREVHQRSGRVPPNATDVEQSVLGAMLLEREAIPKAVEILPGIRFSGRRFLARAGSSWEASALLLRWLAACIR